MDRGKHLEQKAHSCSSKMGRAARLAVTHPEADFRSCCHRLWSLSFYRVFKRMFSEWWCQVRLGGVGKVWQTEGVLVVSAFLVKEQSLHTNTWWSLIPVPAAVTLLGQELLCSGWRWWQCSSMAVAKAVLGTQSLKAQPFTLVPVANVKRLSKYDGCSCSKSECVLVWAELCNFKKSEMLASSVSSTDMSQTKTKPYQNSIRWRCFLRGFHFSGRQSVSFYFLLLLEKRGFEWRIWSSCHVGVCAAWLGCSSVSTWNWKRARLGESIPNSVWEVNAFPDAIRALRIMPDVASEVNFLAHLLISSQQVLRQGSTATVITFPSPGILPCAF